MSEAINTTSNQSGPNLSSSLSNRCCSAAATSSSRMDPVVSEITQRFSSAQQLGQRCCPGTITRGGESLSERFIDTGRFERGGMMQRFLPLAARLLQLMGANPRDIVEMLLSSSLGRWDLPDATASRQDFSQGAGASGGPTSRTTGGPAAASNSNQASATQPAQTPAATSTGANRSEGPRGREDNCGEQRIDDSRNSESRPGDSRKSEKGTEVGRPSDRECQPKPIECRPRRCESRQTDKPGERTPSETKPDASTKVSEREVESTATLSFKEFVTELLGSDEKDAISEVQLQYGIVSYQLYQKSPLLEEQYFEAFESARDNGMSIKAATKDALEVLADQGKLADWEVDWVFSLSFRAAQLDSSPSGLNPRVSDSLDFDEILAKAESALVGIQTGSVTVEDRGPRGVGFANPTAPAPIPEDDDSKKRESVRKR